MFFDEEHIIQDPSLSIRKAPLCRGPRRNSTYYQQLLDAVMSKLGIDPYTPWQNLSPEHRELILNGTEEEVEFTVDKDDRSFTFKTRLRGGDSQPGAPR